ncbi:MAG: hypothetical protein KGZ30_01195 [Anaplasmataceae bacterium]|nr:hypothetical protein [Anaplasmataceae bacterium]
MKKKPRNVPEELRGLLAKAVGRELDEEIIRSSNQALLELRELLYSPLDSRERMDLERALSEELQGSARKVLEFRIGEQKRALDWQQVMLRFIVVAGICLSTDNVVLITETLRQMYRLLRTLDQEVLRLFPSLQRGVDAPLVIFFSESPGETTS